MVKDAKRILALLARLEGHDLVLVLHSPVAPMAVGEHTPQVSPAAEHIHPQTKVARPLAEGSVVGLSGQIQHSFTSAPGDHAPARFTARTWQSKCSMSGLPVSLADMRSTIASTTCMALNSSGVGFSPP